MSSVQDYCVEIRDKDLHRVGILGTQDMTGFTMTREAYDAGSWSLDVPASSPVCALLSAPGAGIIVTGPGFVASGPVVTREWSDGTGDALGEKWTYTGTMDTGILSRCLAMPDPTTAVDAQPESAVWTGPRGSLITGRAYALLAAQGYAVTVEDRGGYDTTDTCTITADWQTLLEAVQSIAAKRVPFGVTQSGGGLVAWIGGARDLTRSVALTTESGVMQSLRTSGSAPSCTRVIVKQTADTVTTYTLVVPERGAELEETWGARTIVHDLSDGETPEAAAAQEVADAYTSMDSASGSLASDALIDGIQPGDLVTVIDGMGLAVADTVTSVTTGFADGVVQTATIGDWGAADSRQILVTRVAEQQRRISRLEHK